MPSSMSLCDATLQCPGTYICVDLQPYEYDNRNILIQYFPDTRIILTVQLPLVARPLHKAPKVACIQPGDTRVILTQYSLNTPPIPSGYPCQCHLHCSPTLVVALQIKKNLTLVSRRRPTFDAPHSFLRFLFRERHPPVNSSLKPEPDDVCTNSITFLMKYQTASDALLLLILSSCRITQNRPQTVRIVRCKF